VPFPLCRFCPSVNSDLLSFIGDSSTSSSALRLLPSAPRPERSPSKAPMQTSVTLSVIYSSLAREVVPVKCLVTITVRGQRCSRTEVRMDRSWITSYFRHAHFLHAGRWNCVLDLAPQRPSTAGQSEPPTPFPVTAPSGSTFFADQQSPQSATAGRKQFVPPSGNVPRSSRPSPSGTSGSIIPSAGHFSKRIHAT